MGVSWTLIGLEIDGLTAYPSVNYWLLVLNFGRGPFTHNFTGTCKGMMTKQEVELHAFPPPQKNVLVVSRWSHNVLPILVDYTLIASDIAAFSSIWTRLVLDIIIDWYLMNDSGQNHVSLSETLTTPNRSRVDIYAGLIYAGCQNYVHPYVFGCLGNHIRTGAVTSISIICYIALVISGR